MELIEAMNKKTILSDEVLGEVFEEQDEIAKARLIMQLSERAAELGVSGQFKTLIAAYKKEIKKNSIPTNQGKSESMTDFASDVYPDMYCGGWIANENGVTMITPFGERCACSHPILPVKVLINNETQNAKIVLAFKRRGKWKEVTVDKDVISSNNKIVSLSKKMINVTTENSKALVQYLSDIETMNENLIPEQMSTSKLGWIKDSFVPYDDRIIFDNESSLNGAFNAVTSKGSYSKWLKLMTMIRSNNKLETNLYLAGSFASPLLHKFNALPFIVSTYGKTGKGKTVALMVASSVWADPEEGKYFTKAKTTDVALEVRLNFLNHLPLAIDDLTQIQKKVKDDFSSFVYDLCAGGGKDRSNQDIGLQAQRSWKNIILTNSERSLINDTMNGGAINRIIEVEASEGNIFDDAPMVVDTIKEHYGYAGEEFIRIISNMTLDELKTIQREFLDRIYERQLELGEEKEEKQIIPMSILLTADKIVTEQIFEDGNYLDFDRCYCLLKNKSDVSEEERAYDFIMSDIEMNINKFKPDIYGTYKGEIWGCIEKGYAIINSNAFNGMCDRGNFSRKSFLSWADRNGYLKSSAAGEPTKTKKISGNAMRCVFLKMDTLPDESDESVENTEFREINEQEEIPFDND